MRRSTLILAAALAASGPAWLPGPMDVAHAQQKDDKAKRAEASRHFQLGVRLYAEGKYDEALIEFQRAYELSPHPSVLYNIAASYRELSRYAESIQFFEQFLVEGQGQVKPDLLARAEKELQEVRGRIGTVTLDLQPDGVAVSVDGRTLSAEQQGEPVILGPGQHTFTLRAPSGRVETHQITIASGDALTLTDDLTRPATATGTGTTVAVPPVDPGTGDTGATGATGSTTGIGIGAGPGDRARGSMGLSGGIATNLRLIGDTGAPVLGGHAHVGPVVLGADVILVAWAVVPSLRVHLTGDRVAVHAIAAVPISITDGEDTDVFVAGAAGLGLRTWIAPALALRLEALVSVAGGDHGVNVPVSMAIELWR